MRVDVTWNWFIIQGGFVFLQGGLFDNPINFSNSCDKSFNIVVVREVTGVKFGPVEWVFRFQLHVSH